MEYVAANLTHLCLLAIYFLVFAPILGWGDNYYVMLFSYLAPLPCLFIYHNLSVSAVMIIPWHLTDSLLLLCDRNLILSQLDILSSILQTIMLQITFTIVVLPILGYDDNSIAPVRLDDTGLYLHSVFLQHYTEHSAATLCCIVCYTTVLFICCLCVL